MSRYSSEFISSLLPFIPTLTSWLAHHNRSDAGDHFAHYGPKQLNPSDLHTALHALRTHRDLLKSSSMDLRELLKEFPVDMWYRVTFVLLTSPECPLLSKSSYEDLAQKKYEFKDLVSMTLDEIYSSPKSIEDILNDNEELFEDAWTFTERLSVENFIALGDLCSFIRDYSSNVEAVCKMVSQAVILPETQEVDQFYSGRQGSKRRMGSKNRKKMSKISDLSGDGSKMDLSASPSMSVSGDNVGPAVVSVNDQELAVATMVLMFLVKFAEIIFNKPRQKAIKKIPPFGLRQNIFRPVAFEELQMKRQKDQLKTFYKRVDGGYISIVDRLFNYFTFPDIAQAIFNEYRLLPESWLAECSSYVADHPQEKAFAAWVRDNKDSFREVNADTQLSSIKVRPKKVYPREKDGLDMIVEEIVSKEFEYYDRLNALYSDYASDLMQISFGASGEKAQKRLGLSSADVQKLFGKRLTYLLEAVRGLLVQLEVLRLVTGPVTVRNQDGSRTRAGIAAEILFEHADRLIAAYKRYTTSFQTAQKVLDGARKSIELDKSKHEPGLKTFLDIWYDKVESNDQLKMQQIDAILILPIRRFPNYVLYFHRMQKELKKHTGELTIHDQNMLAKAQGRYESVATFCNNAIKTTQKALQLLGDEPDQLHA